jgi:hypothetical protein
LISMPPCAKATTIAWCSNSAAKPAINPN